MNETVRYRQGGGFLKSVAIFFVAFVLGIAVTLGGIDNSFGTAWRVLSADTQTLEEDTYHKNYSMRFWAICSYSDGSVQASAPDGIYCQRSAAEVASAALADTTVQYDQKIVEHLLQILDAVTA